MLRGKWDCGKHWSQGKSLWGNPKPPPTAEPVDLLLEFCKCNGCGHTGYPGSFPEESAVRPPLQPWFPYLLCQSSADPKLLAMLCQIPAQSCCAAVTAAAVAPEIIPREV